MITEYFQTTAETYCSEENGSFKNTTADNALSYPRALRGEMPQHHIHAAAHGLKSNPISNLILKKPVS